MARACFDSGTSCGRRIFIRSAGMRHSAASRSNSDQVALISSPVRTKTPVTAAEQERFQLDYMRQFQELRDELLEEHRLALRTLRGEHAYEVVPPMDQTDFAMGDGLREMKRAAKKMVGTLVFIRHEQLTDEGRRKNADAQAKAAMFAGMIRNPQLLSPKQIQHRG